MTEKRSGGRPRIDPIQKKERWAKYINNTSWVCETCNNNINYKLRGRTNHLNTKKHKRILSELIVKGEYIENLEKKVGRPRKKN